MATATAPNGDLAAELNDPHCLTPEQADTLLRGAPWRRFVILGDSIAEGLGERAPGYGPDNWGRRVARALARRQPDLEYRNLGQRYLRAAQVHATQLQEALSFKPDLAAVVCGGNDALADDFDPGRLELELGVLIAPLRAAGADVITFTLFDITKAIEVQSDFGRRLDAHLAAVAEVTTRLAERHGTIHVDMRSHPASADPGIYSSDRMHATTRGHAIVAAATIRALGTRLGNEVRP